MWEIISYSAPKSLLSSGAVILYGKLDPISMKLEKKLVTITCRSFLTRTVEFILNMEYYFGGIT